MNEPERRQTVIVTDIKMPFWSMVVFMVKWAIAAIPALLLLGLIGFACSILLSQLFTLPAKRTSTIAPSPPQQSSIATTGPRTPDYTGPLVDRCKGSYEPAKCMELERKLAEETPEQRAQRQRDFERERRANMERVGK
jgi:hypothetical protein